MKQTIQRSLLIITLMAISYSQTQPACNTSSLPPVEINNHGKRVPSGISGNNQEFSRLPDTFETERLRFRRATPADKNRLVTILSDQETMKWLYFQNLDAIKDFADTLYDVNSFYYIGNCYHIIIEKNSGNMIGTIGLSKPGGKVNEAHVCYAIAADARGKKYATEVVKKVVAISFDLGIEAIKANVLKGNAPSQAVLKNCGLKFSGVWGLTSPDHNKAEGVFYLTKAQWEQLTYA